MYIQAGYQNSIAAYRLEKKQNAKADGTSLPDAGGLCPENFREYTLPVGLGSALPSWYRSELQCTPGEPLPGLDAMHNDMQATRALMATMDKFGDEWMTDPDAETYFKTQLAQLREESAGVDISLLVEHLAELQTRLSLDTEIRLLDTLV